METPHILEAKVKAKARAMGPGILKWVPQPWSPGAHVWRRRQKIRITIRGKWVLWGSSAQGARGHKRAFFHSARLINSCFPLKKQFLKNLFRIQRALHTSQRTEFRFQVSCFAGWLCNLDHYEPLVSFLYNKGDDDDSGYFTELEKLYDTSKNIPCKALSTMPSAQ